MNANPPQIQHDVRIGQIVRKGIRTPYCWSMDIDHGVPLESKFKTLDLSPTIFYNLKFTDSRLFWIPRRLKSESYSSLNFDINDVITDTKDNLTSHFKYR